MSMVERYCGGVVLKGERNEIDKADEADARANEYVDRQAPWKLAKDPAIRSQLENTLATLVRQLARQAVYLWPFMPGKSQELWKSLGAPGSPGEMRFSEVERLDPTGWNVAKGSPLFPKADTVPSGETAR